MGSVCDLVLNTSFKVSGKLGNKVFAITNGTNWCRAYFIPSNPRTQIQQNNRHAFRLLNLLFSALGKDMKIFWSKLSNSKGLPKPNYFVSRGMKEYISQLGVFEYPDNVLIEGVYPYEVWKWEK